MERVISFFSKTGILLVTCLSVDHSSEHMGSLALPAHAEE